MGCTEAADAPSDAGQSTTAVTVAPESSAASTAASTTAPDTGSDTASTAAETDSTGAVESTVAAPTGEPFVIGVVNTEGAPGLDFPEFTTAFEAAAEHINRDLGGFKGRPVQLQPCIAKGSPESSQACAQELAEQQVDLVMLGIDIFVAYPTYAAAGIPVIGAVPVLPTDYTADAVFITAGNLVVQGSTANAITSPDYLGLKRVAVITNDSAQLASALGVLTPALEKGGATVTVVTGGQTETDAGYLSLMQEAADSDPEAIVSLYGETGCVALMRARRDLGITAPVFSNTSCLSKRVTDAAGDAAIGWYFAGATGEDNPDDDVVRRYVSEITGGDPADVDLNGFTTVGWGELISIWASADSLDGEVSGPAIIEAFRAGRGTQLGNGDPAPCGQVEAYKSVCTFSIPFAQFTAPGAAPAFGGEMISAVELLPA
ncbi:MAG: ABC transporter substrate-binding protein [Ilumatobacteraceae bacterium]